ncbi:MAG: hypothetical protein PHV34_00445 [Verrucomicrobiae bacterium]|nr:hypothetical protein [Verrucomicrobiae bacterium]
MKRQHIWCYGLLALAAIWILAAAGMALARSRRMTAEKVITHVQANALAGKTAAERDALIREMAGMVNHLSFEDRQQVRFKKETSEFYRSMNEQERLLYVDMTLPKGMHQMMEAFNNMTPARRKQIVNRALNDISRLQDDSRREEINRALSDEAVKRVIDQGLKSYMGEANAETKLDLQPLIEQMQGIMQNTR